jgi:RNA polymerase sigma-70 factor (ECF subfamily)
LKVALPAGHTVVVEQAIATITKDEATEVVPSLDVTQVYAAHADMVWSTLQRLGVHPADLEDVLQEVFVVVHQRLHTFDHSAKITTWLFGICLRVTSHYRRRAFRRYEQPTEVVPEDDSAPPDIDPEQAAADRQWRQRLHEILDKMDPDKRVVFVMFEVDELPCDEIAARLGIPEGTVYSRLHAARQQFEKHAARLRARDGGGGR